jgi:hypothetical protein
MSKCLLSACLSSKLSTRLVPDMKGYNFKQEDFWYVGNNKTGGNHEIIAGGIIWKGQILFFLMI